MCVCDSVCVAVYVCVYDSVCVCVCMWHVCVCFERDFILASVYVLIVFVCTGTPIANLTALLLMLCNFFRSVIGAAKDTS